MSGGQTLRRVHGTVQSMYLAAEDCGHGDPDMSDGLHEYSDEGELLCRDHWQGYYLVIDEPFPPGSLGGVPGRWSWLAADQIALTREPGGAS